MTIRFTMLGGLHTDIKQALRFLRRRPGFSAAIVLTVALVIAATTAFAVVDGVLLLLLLTTLAASHQQHAFASCRSPSVSAPDREP